MTEEVSTIAHPTETGMTQTTPAEDDAITSSLSRGIRFYFQCAIVVIGLVATATNALVLYALVASKQHRKHVLICNQNAFDLFASFFLTVTYSLILCNVYFTVTGSAGYWLCTLLLSESLSSSANTGSVISLAVISVERYLKIVHRTWSKKYLRKPVIYSAAALAWITSVIYNLALVFPTTRVIDGICHPYEFWYNPTARVAHLIWNFALFYVTTLLIFTFCYGRILVVIRRQASVMAAHNTSGGSSNAPSQFSHIQTSIIKTMVFVSLLFAITWLPNYISVLFIALNPNYQVFESGYYASSVFIAYLYFCVNPFIYATKFHPVKEILLRMIPCKKISEEDTENVAGT